MSNRNDMPKPITILKYWCEKLITKNNKFWLDVYFENDCNNNEKTQYCFACGCNIPTQRSHIIALCNGGSNDVSNLHLLCKECHLESESIENIAKYELWFNSKNSLNSGSYLRLLNLAKLYQSE